MLVNPGRIAQAVRDVIAGRPPVPRHWLPQGSGRPPAAPTPVTSAQTATATPPAPSAPAAVTPAAPSADQITGEEPILMPFGDLTVSQGTLIRWIKARGDRVNAGELVAEIETDKAVVEIEAPSSGVLSSVEAEVGQVVAMGARIGGITR